MLDQAELRTIQFQVCNIPYPNISSFIPDLNSLIADVSPSKRNFISSYVFPSNPSKESGCNLVNNKSMSIRLICSEIRKKNEKHEIIQKSLLNKAPWPYTRTTPTRFAPANNYMNKTNDHYLDCTVGCRIYWLRCKSAANPMGPPVMPERSVTMVLSGHMTCNTPLGPLLEQMKRPDPVSKLVMSSPSTYYN